MSNSVSNSPSKFKYDAVWKRYGRPCDYDWPFIYTAHVKIVYDTLYMVPELNMVQYCAVLLVQKELTSIGTQPQFKVSRPSMESPTSWSCFQSPREILPSDFLYRKKGPDCFFICASVWLYIDVRRVKTKWLNCVITWGYIILYY